MLIFGTVKSFGPHHCLKDTGSVHAFQRSSRGASKMRVMTSSCSATFAAGCSIVNVVAMSVLLFRRLIPQQDVPVAESPCIDKLQSQPVLQAFEHGLPLAEDDRVQQDLILIDQALLRQLGHNAAASQDRQILA